MRKYVNECYNELKTQSEVFKQDMDSKSILQQYLLTMEKYNLSFDDVVALTSDFLSGGIDTVIYKYLTIVFFFLNLYDLIF